MAIQAEPLRTAAVPGYAPGMEPARLVIFIGTDAPDLVPTHLRAAVDAVGTGRAVIDTPADLARWPDLAP